MSPATVERGVAARADSNFYTGGPSSRSPFATSPETEQVGGLHPPIAASRKRRPSLVYAEIARIVRRSWKHTKAGFKSRTGSEDLVFESVETTGRASHQVLELVGELATQPRPSAKFGQSAKHTNDRFSVRDDALSFRSEAGGRVTFFDIELSSDEDLIEAGYPFFSHAEDPELAAESRRSFLKRMGLGLD